MRKGVKLNYVYFHICKINIMCDKVCQNCDSVLNGLVYEYRCTSSESKSYVGFICCVRENYVDNSKVYNPRRIDRERFTDISLTDEQELAAIQSMAGCWPDRNILSKLYKSIKLKSKRD